MAPQLRTLLVLLLPALAALVAANERTRRTVADEDLLPGRFRRSGSEEFDGWPDSWYINDEARVGGSDLDVSMNVEGAWAAGYTGKGVVISVVDDGLEHTHRELAGAYDPEASTDLNEGDRDPLPRYEPNEINKQGTRCAGLVVANSTNSFCARGVAPGARIGGIKLLDGAITDTSESDAIGFNPNHIDVYSFAWGPNDDGKTVDGPGRLARASLESGAKHGRGGKGSIFVWAAGTGGKKDDECNCDGYVTSPYTIPISSVTRDGFKPWYAETCSSILASTYSTGRADGRDRNRNVVTSHLNDRCTTTFAGTSVSAALGAGMVALALEANPELTYRDVQHIIVRTAQPDPELHGNFVTNAAGKAYSNSFGFGLMDALAMVQEAETWRNVPAKTVCRTDVKNVTSKLLVEVDGGPCGHITSLEHVQLHLKVESSSSPRGKFSVKLTSAHDTVSVLLSERPNDDVTGDGLDRFATWPMSSVAFWGEPVSADEGRPWLVTVHNSDSQALKRILEVGITFHGTTAARESVLDNEVDSDTQ